MFRDRLLAPNGRFRSNFAVLAHNVDSDMIHITHRASLASLKKLSSESNYGGKKILVCHEANIYVAREVFFCHVLRILMSELGLKEPSLGIKERCCVIGMFVIIMSAEHD